MRRNPKSVHDVLDNLMEEFLMDQPRTRAQPSKATHDKWTDDHDVVWWVHRWNPGCVEYGCAIHAPTDHEMSDWPQVMATGTIVVRLCKHDKQHPDPDSLNFFKRQGQERMGVHDCDGCCKQRPKPRGGETRTVPAVKYEPNYDHHGYDCEICNEQ